ncbi:hypothetical protein BDP27DRAFT_1270798, partial [Rhodocollybia butyracea]
MNSYHQNTQYRDSNESGLQLLNKYVAIDASYRSRHPGQECQPRTRGYILQKLQNWINDGSSSKSVYWLHGPLGVGKSAIAQTISSMFCESKLAASFFFSRDDGKCNNFAFFFTTIAWQLANNPVLGRKLRFFINEAVCNNRDILGQSHSLEQQYQAFIRNPVQQMNAQRQEGNLQCFIVIDALDECMNVSDQKRLLSLLLQEAKAHCLPFKILIVSRSEPDFHKLFGQQQYSVFLDQNEIGDSSQSSLDIQLFLEAKFKMIRDRPEHTQAMENAEQDWPGPARISRIVERACGQFIYATTVINYVDDFNSATNTPGVSVPEDQLAIVEKIQVPHIQQSPYTELDCLYMQVL